MGFLSLPFMSLGGGGGTVVIEVAASRVATLPQDTLDVSGSASGGSMSAVPAAWEIDSALRTITLLAQVRVVSTQLENRTIVLGVQSRTILA